MSIFSKTTFLFLNKLTLFSLFILILAGGVVRSTGSGMGCPDWPKCFDRYIPPTSIDQLPVNYQQIYKDRGYENTTFNVNKTWTEYINRLIGAITGLFIFATLVSSFQFLKSKPFIFYLVLASFLLVGFQAWLGGKVVESNLHALMITAHMFVALIILGILLYTYVISVHSNFQIKKYHFSTSISLVLSLCFLFTIIQIALGTQVREAVDQISKMMNFADRGTWVELAGAPFFIHRSLSILVLTLNVILFVKTRAVLMHSSFLTLLLRSNISLILLQIISGIVLSYLDLPPTFQAIHLFLATLLFSVQLSMVFLFFNKMKPESNFVLQS